LAHLLSHGAVVNDVLPNGQAPLHIAAFWSSTRHVEQLLQYGAFVNHQDNKGKTALHLSVCVRKYRRKILCLLAYGSDANLPDKDGNIALHICRCRIYAMDMLEHNASVSAQNNLGESVLHLAVKRDWMDVVLRILQKGAKPNLTNHDGESPVHYAAKFARNKDILVTLLEYGGC